MKRQAGSPSTLTDKTPVLLLTWQHRALRRKSKLGLAPHAIPVHDARVMKAVTDKLRNFLQYVAVKLIDDPTEAQLKVAEVGSKRLRFKLVLAQADVAMLIGRNGFTASAIRSVLKAAAEREGVQVSLQIHSHEEEAEMMAREDGAGK
jgi:predicted RNA-binding protein YlqC (UPF0109 family)